MKFLGFLVGFLFFAGGMLSQAVAKTVFQETTSAIAILTGSMCIAVAAVLDAMDAAAKRDEKAAAQRDQLIKLLSETQKQQEAAEALNSELLAQQNVALGQIAERMAYGNSLLKWIGEQEAARQQSPAAPELAEA